METTALLEVITRYKNDPESVYNTWFVSGGERMKAFRSIRRGVKDVVESIGAGTFGNDFRGSTLEVVLTAITEQKQVFEGAAHPFYWKPKLRIPDIYEDETNKKIFGAFLAACLTATRDTQVLAEMSRLGAAKIKGLGPACANIIYFLHPTLVPPFNTAMVNGFNALFDARKKLGSWESYLEMREMIVQTNTAMRNVLSKDLGAFAGLLFEIGAGRLLIDTNADRVFALEKEKAEKAARIRHSQVLAEQKEESEHTQIQYLLIKIGRSLHYDVYVARNDRHRSYNGESFALLTTPNLPQSGWPAEVMDTVSLIDVIWLHPQTHEIVSAFEVEKSTSIYSGMLRLEDLAGSLPDCTCHFYLLVPGSREKEVMAQLARPAFRRRHTSDSLNFILFEDLCEHCDALCKFGEDRTILQKIIRNKHV
jgi:type II restriction enzyme